MTTPWPLKQAQFLDGALKPSVVKADGVATRAVHFIGPSDGTALYRTSTPSVANSHFGICSYWFRSSGSTNDPVVFTLAKNNGSGYPDGIGVSTNSGSTVATVIDGGPFMVVDNNSLSAFGIADTAGSYFDGVWHHFLYAWDTNHNAGLKIGQMVVDGVLKSATLTDAAAAFDVVWHITSCGIVIGGFGFSGVPSTANAEQPGTFDLTEFYLNTQEYLDISVAGNVQKFRTVGGKPANLGSTGSTPTGNPPTIYLSVSSVTGNPTTFAFDQSGNGNNFTVFGNLSSATGDPF